ncbi:MAG: hypothetical protein U5L74_03745, partial [Ideonella sp.]|nr:hypothetical protein [Ideonella sp.]
RSRRRLQEQQLLGAVAKPGGGPPRSPAGQARHHRGPGQGHGDTGGENIAHYKVPRYIRFVDELPITVTGKPQKFVMRELMMRELGLSLMATA